MGLERTTGTVGMLAHSYYLRDPRVRRTAETLARAGWAVHVVSLGDAQASNGARRARRETVNGVHIHRLPLAQHRGGSARYAFEFGATTLLGLQKLFRLHLRHKFDVVHVHNMPDFLAVAGLPAKWLGATLVLDVHDPMSELFQSQRRIGPDHWLARLLRYEEKLSYRLPDRLMTVSSSMAENLSRKSGRPLEDITVIHNTPDWSAFPPVASQPAWPRNPGAFVLLYSGTVTDHYRLDVAVRAVALAAPRIPGLRLEILGEGNRIDDVLELADRLGIADRVGFLGLVDTDEVRPIMDRADAGVSPHQGGAFGDLYFSNKMLEFMNRGLPLLTSRTATVARYLPEDAVFFFRSGDPADCARAILEMWRNPGLVHMRIRRALDIAGRLSWDNERVRLLDFYASCLSGGRNGGHNGKRRSAAS